MLALLRSEGMGRVGIAEIEGDASEGRFCAKGRRGN